ncbi:MAG: NAD(P)-dependent glycerol-3-phosphate dehydrogenase [Gammaproteobacteria bacterium]|nr:NAD(P)-dependent glycerol-3-phosphate dehydrogenase [Gammaproteobacteria bacterium]
MKAATFAILGAGSWGTAVAIHLAKAKHRVLLWGPTKDALLQMEKTRTNERYLPDIPFPTTLLPQPDLAACLKEADEVCIAAPSHAFHAVLDTLTTPPKHGLLWLTKGMDPDTHLLLSQLVKSKWGADFPCAMLSGPSFALEMARGLPTAVSLACDNPSYQKRLLPYFQHAALRVYLSQDLIGVQLCGVVKNVLAIACGMSDGLGFGANAKAALITRGLAEMRRLGLAMGAMEQTFIGLAGIGDLVLTCTDNQSRNRRFGLALGQGDSPHAALAKINQVVEGRHNAAQVVALAEQYHLSLPICEAVLQVLQDKQTPQEAATYLIHKTSANPYEM